MSTPSSSDGDARLGLLEAAGDDYRLRFTRRLPHPQARVWQALTRPEQLAAWFPQRIETATGWAVGAKLTFHDPHDRGPAFDGEVLAFQPESLIEFTWGTDTIRLEIRPEPAADGSETSVLTLYDTLEQRGTGARNAAGWHECLDYLEARLADRAPSFEPGARWAAVHQRYVAALGPEAATIGPPAGWKPDA